MIKSMTGYGRHESVIDGKNIIVEIKSVNHRYFELNSRISKEYGFLEDKIKKLINEKVLRGKVDVFVGIQTLEDENVEVIINDSLVLGYVKALNEIKEKYSLKGDVSISTISKYSDIFTIKNSKENDDKIWNDVLKVAKNALDKFIDMREKEGEFLKLDIKQKACNILEVLNKIESRIPKIVLDYEARLKCKIKELILDNDIDEQRILTEVAIFADKTAVDEEIVRLKSHLRQLDSMIESDVSVGRKIDFLIQEMNRESNTIGSKCLDSDVSLMVVDIKANIEKMREQVQNIE